MKKGTLGMVTLILGILVLACGIAKNLVTNIPALYSASTIILLIGFVPAIVLGIISIVKNSNRSLAIIGMVLAVIGMWIAPWVVRIIVGL